VNPDQFESPFLDAEFPLFPSANGSSNGHQEAPAELETRFDDIFSGEAEESEAEDTEVEESEGEDTETDQQPEEEANPDLFDPAELESSWAGADHEADQESEGETAEESEGEEVWITPELSGEDNESPFLAGESPFLSGEEEGGGEDGQIVYLKKEAEDLEEQVGPAPAPTPVVARILWPALGFPAVITPRAGATGDPLTDGDATRCITVLLRSNRKNLSKAEAAKYLRYVQWHERGRRHIESGAGGSFREEELAVRNNEAGPKLVFPTPKNSSGVLIAFGGDREGENSITVSLSSRVGTFYDQQGLQHLHEIRISEAASARLADGQYHLFWNNQAASEDAPSDEMGLLLRRFAEPRRSKLGELWEKHRDYLLKEYEYEYGLLHPPYVSKLRMRTPRAEILHPLFVDRKRTGPLKIGHMTDTHVDVRADVYEHNLRQAGEKVHYNNFNRSFDRVYAHCRKASDVLLMTGDLVDYGRGHWGLIAGDRLGDDDAYHVDRNWFLFYFLLASGDSYQCPVYTSLGNHDWRLNPYPPFAPGAPDPVNILHDYARYDNDRRKEILRHAHGPGWEKKFSYYTKAKGKLELLTQNTGSALKALWAMFRNKQTMDEPHMPTETTVESVAWYLFSINPFLDYSFALPSGQRVLILDWAEDEDVLFPVSVRGKSWPYMVWQAEQASDPGPKARNCLTALQQWLTRDFLARPGSAKVIGIHAPPIGPYPDWYDADLYRSRKDYAAEKEPRGPTDYATRYADGRVDKWNGHPIFALRPKNGVEGVAADYGSFERGRESFIKEVAKPGSGVRAVFSGHIHRNNLLLTYVSEPSRGPAVAGEVRVRAITPQLARGVRPPGVSPVPEGTHGPLYVNTTTAGLRGHFYPAKGKQEAVDPGYSRLDLAADGTIVQVEFIAPPVPAPQAAGVPATHEMEGTLM
jgi:hypothetical protein